MFRIGQNKFSHIKIEKSQVTICNFRDFFWQHEDYTQTQNWIEYTFSSQNITAVHLYVNSFGPRNLVAHTMLAFTMVGGEQIVLSVEGQLKQGEEYSFWKALFPGYRLQFIRGSYRDIIGLRAGLRQATLYEYPLHLTKEQINILFMGLLQQTNIINNKISPYSIFTQNCTSAPRYVAKKYFPLPFWHRTLLFTTYIPGLLAKLGIVKLKERRVVSQLYSKYQEKKALSAEKVRNELYNLPISEYFGEHQEKVLFNAKKSKRITVNPTEDALEKIL